MSKIKWDAVGERIYETGVSKGVLYKNKADGSSDSGVPWNGLIGVSESPTGAEPSPLYSDNTKYLNLMSVEEYKSSIEAYTYPEEFEECDGSKEIATGVSIGQQVRTTFGFCYRTEVGNDTQGIDHGYKLHLVYNCMASPSEKGYKTINDSPEAITFSWELSTTPVDVTDHKPTACLTIDSRRVNAEKLKLIEDKLYGADASEPTLPTPDEIAAIIGAEG